jgi:hypothetical protein
MFPMNSPELMLEMHHQRAAELHRAAAAYRMAHEAGTGRHRRFGRWPRASARPRPVHAPVAP